MVVGIESNLLEDGHEKSNNEATNNQVAPFVIRDQHRETGELKVVMVFLFSSFAWDVTRMIELTKLVCAAAYRLKRRVAERRNIIREPINRPTLKTINSY